PTRGRPHADVLDALFVDIKEIDHRAGPQVVSPPPCIETLKDGPTLFATLPPVTEDQKRLKRRERRAPVELPHFLNLVAEHLRVDRFLVVAFRPGLREPPESRPLALVPADQQRDGKVAALFTDIDRQAGVVWPVTQPPGDGIHAVQGLNTF